MNSPRILAQRGVFTIHGKLPVCINDLVNKMNDNDYPMLEKIVISGKSKRVIHKWYFTFCNISGTNRDYAGTKA